MMMKIDNVDNDEDDDIDDDDDNDDIVSEPAGLLLQPGVTQVLVPAVPALLARRGHGGGPGHCAGAPRGPGHRAGAPASTQPQEVSPREDALRQG